ncbi:hypothetical protein CI102_2778 [Trichoderma harzianum]|uniref:Uncharacterized protein n=1 Tax=Trichoderma harzianum CBS 226.95 TaxID=983964 RepID=A0A2T4A9S5_TRIHA|nr:hypothetical protein M431DRAFT_443706 [Trichoderma harzianum CBS 226.95]PKK51182.1 hypothetical protein CI102_2778 [Trichoderma harzianum]PTB53743.1 hypothetical protein M431DRAFT_443706 [Trichoderma harzianum CBS 226.95]
MYFYPTAVLALGASPKIQFAGDKSSLHWYCDLPLHCSVLCHDTLDMPCPCPALCLVGDKTCRAFYAPSSSRASFELRGGFKSPESSQQCQQHGISTNPHPTRAAFAGQYKARCG